MRDNWPDIKSFFASDPLLGSYVDSLPVERIPINKPSDEHPVTWYFSRLNEDIIGQQLSGRVASVIVYRFRQALADDLSAPHILAVEPQVLRDAGLSWAKVHSVKHNAALTLAGEVAWEQLPQLSDVEVVNHLCQIKGVGPWTAQMFLLFTLGRPDIFAPADLGLRKAIQQLWQMPHLPKPEEANQLTLRWQPYRSYASLLLWWSIDTIAGQGRRRDDQQAGAAKK